jgi:hypothetical protein
MSRVPELTRVVKAETKCFGFWRKTSTAKSARSISDNILSYLDETSKSERRTIFGVTEQKRYTNMVFGPPDAQLAGIDYLTKEETGKVSVYGFLREDISRMAGLQPDRLDNDTRVIACHNAWLQRMEAHKEAKKFGHKFVLSLDPRFCALMAAAGRDVDALLIEGFRTVLRRYQEKYYPGDKLGYLAGIHHDRKHIHAHVLLFPFTERGKNLNVSNGKGGQRLQSMVDTADKFVRSYFHKTFEYPIRASERPLDRVIQHRLITSYLIDVYEKLSPAPKESSMVWLSREQKRIKSLPEPEVREILTKAYEMESARHAVMLENPASIAGLGQEQKKATTWFRHLLQRTDERTKDLHARMAKLQEEHNLAFRACSNYKFYLNKAKSGIAVGSGLPLMDEESPAQRKWLTETLQESGTGERLEMALRELDRRRAPSWRLLQNGAVNVIAAMNAHGMLYTPRDQMEKQDTNQRIRSSQDFMRKFYLQRLEQLKTEREKLRVELEENRSVREGARLMLDVAQLYDVEMQAAVKGRRPLFLEQYEGIKRTGGVLPVVCRGKEAELSMTKAAASGGTFEDVNRRILETLRAFQGDEQSSEALLEVDRYFRDIMAATAGRARPKPRRTLGAGYSKSPDQPPLVGVSALEEKVDVIPARVVSNEFEL